jgi:hypothetical protein
MDRFSLNNTFTALKFFAIKRKEIILSRCHHRGINKVDSQRHDILNQVRQ